MKRDTGDEIRMKLRYGRSNPWFSIRRFITSPFLPDTLLQFVRVSYKGCATSDSTRRKGFVFFSSSPSPFSPFPSFFSSRVEIRDRCLTYSRIPQNKKQFRAWKFEFTRGKGRDKIETCSDIRVSAQI